MGNTGEVAWDEYVRHAKTYFDTGNLERDEINYKVAIGNKLALAREALHAGSDDWARQVDAALPSGNIIHYVPKSNFSRWLVGFPEESKRAFRALWTQERLFCLGADPCFWGPVPS